MELGCFTIWDKKAEAGVTPFFAANTAVAMRDFKSACNDVTHAFYRNPEDYSLWFVGTFDQGNKKLKAEDVVCVAEALAMKEVE